MDFIFAKVCTMVHKKLFQQGFQGARNSKLSVLRDPPELELLDLARISNLGKGGGNGMAAGFSSEFPDVSEESEDLRSVNWPSEDRSMRLRHSSQLRANFRIPAAVTW